MIRLLFTSTRQQGHLALDSPEGHTLSSRQRISVKQSGYWIPGIVESDGIAYMLIPDSGGWEARIELRPGMSIKDDTTLEDNYPARKNEWWEEAPEEFANGFTEEVQVHHQTESEAMADTYGPAAPFSENKPGEHITYRRENGLGSGTIVYVQAPAPEAKLPIRYVVTPDGDTGELPGLPDIVWPSDVVIQ